MAKLSNYRRILSTDYEPQYKAVIDQLATSLNNSFDEIYSALNNNLTFTDNISGTVTTITATVDASGNPNRTVQFKLNTNQSTLSGLIVINAYGANDSTITPSGGIFVSFSKNTNLVTITNIKGLQANIAYTITLIALG